MGRITYILSDLHIGAGDYLDDFDQDKSFKYFLEAISRHPGSELIINGDFIDFVSVTLKDETASPFSRLGSTEGESLRKLERVIKAHPAVFSVLRRFTEEKGHRLVLIPGNHDIDFLWPEVRGRLLEVIGDPGPDLFYFEESGVYRDGGLYVEHGGQYFSDTVFENFSKPFLEDPGTGETRLERCWANCFHDYITAGILGRHNPFFNNVRPIPNMIYMCIQDEVWWLKLIFIYKLLRFISKAGFPPFEESREVLLEKRGMSGVEGEYATRHFSMEYLTGSDAAETRGIDGEMKRETGMTEEREVREPEELVLPVDSLAARENTLMMTARDLLLADEGLDVVAFGHEHQYFSNELSPDLDDKEGKYYVNTGTWIPMLYLNRTRRMLRWRDLRDQRLYQQLLTYCVIRRDDGRAKASLKCIKQVAG